MQQFSLAFPIRAPRLAWFAGAGTSAAAGIPTGYDMILDFKTRLFCAATGLPRSEIDPGDPLWVKRITTYFDDAHGLPALGSPDEYAAAFEAVFPDPSDRRAYIESAVRRGTPSFGHRVLGALISSRHIPAVFTTNFDPLIENASLSIDELLPAQERARVAVAAPDSAERAERCVRESSWPMLVKLHGDFQSVRLKNTALELSSQDERLRRVLIEVCQRFGLVVVGYSGRDASVMEALVEGIKSSSSYSAGLFWICRPGSTLLPAVVDLLEGASAAGVAAHIVEAENFDELGGALEQQTSFDSEVGRSIRAARPAARVTPVAIPTVEAAPFPVLRTSALPLLAIPTSARRITLSEPATTPELKQLLRQSGARRLVVSATGPRELAAFGSDAALLSGLASLGPRLAGEIAIDAESDAWALGFIYESLVRALSGGRPLRPELRRRGHTLVVQPPEPSWTDSAAQRSREAFEEVRRAYGGAIVGTVPGINLPFAEAAGVRLERWLDRWWCVLDPNTHVEMPNRSTETDTQSRASGLVSAAADWRRERWAKRYNQDWSKIIAAWANLLAPERETEVCLHTSQGTPGVEARFLLSGVTAWSRPASQQAQVGGAAQ